jgi:hypothetical protein
MLINILRMKKIGTISLINCQKGLMITVIKFWMQKLNFKKKNKIMEI